MELKNLFGGVYRNKKVLITGNTGFKGSWLSYWLVQIGADVYGISKDIPTHPSNYEALELNKTVKHKFIDIRDLDKLNSLIGEIKPDFIFHLAAQPLVSRSYIDPPETFTTNVIGTVNVLESMKNLESSCVGIIITSDKCYDNQEWEWGYRETDRLGGKDPYSASKGAAELVFYSYYHSFFKRSQKIRIASARAGNVIGGGDWAIDRIIPDCIRAWSSDKVVEIRNPHSTRPWQHVLEPLSGYLRLGQALSMDDSLNGESFNFGPSDENNHSVLELISGLRNHWGGAGEKFTVIQNNNYHEAGLLKLNCDKSLNRLQWKAILDFNDVLKYTTEWYHEYYFASTAGIQKMTYDQIMDYCKKSLEKKLAWCLPK
jgi:CDP-glucose 4,6-dehydratase